MAVQPHAIRQARRLLTYIVEENGTPCEVEFASGEILRCGAGNPRIFVKFHTDRVLHGNLSELSLGKAYLDGEWDFEGDTLNALDLRHHLQGKGNFYTKLKFVTDLFFKPATWVNKRAIAAHYSFGNDFYLTLTVRRILCTVILVCAAVTLAAGQDVATKSAATADVQQILKDRFREYTEALTKRDLAALDKIWADGYTFTNGRGEFLTKTDRMENIKSGATQFDSISREDEETRVFGDTAVVTGRVVLKVIYSGKESSGPYRFINVWVKMQGRWQVAANQITPIAQ